MKISERWLREWVNPKITSDELALELTMLGLEVDSLTPITMAGKPDICIDIELTPNRGDCLSVQGVAREVAVRHRCSLKKPEIQKIKSVHSESLDVSLKAEKACPHYAGRFITDINPDAKTPAWLEEKLACAGISSIHPVVDVTNYVMLELGQPMHAFDAKQVSREIIVRFATSGEKIILLDGETLELKPTHLVIADQKKALALAGVMGGLDSGVTTLTQSIFLESAYFDPITIGQQARNTGITSDSSQRFERGVDPTLQLEALERATTLLLEIVGGKPGPITEVFLKSHLPVSPTIQLRHEQIKRILGISLESSFIVETLELLGCHVSEDKKNRVWQVTPPPHRFDLTIEVDLIEELARIHGYQQIPETSPQVACRLAPEAIKETSNTLQWIKRLKQVLADAGYQEAITYTFVDPAFEKHFDVADQPFKLRNPISQDLSVMRSSLWPGLLKAIAYNQNRQQNTIRLFEVGLRFVQTGKTLLQEKVISGCCYGEAVTPHWTQSKRAFDFFDIKADVLSLFQLDGEEEHLSFEAAAHPALHPGQSAVIHYRSKPIGYCGAIHPAVMSALSLKGPIFVFELTTAFLNTFCLKKYQPISKFPSITRDLAFVVSREVKIGDILSKTKETVGNLLKKIEIFDVYHGKELESKTQGVGIRLTLQHDSRTLIDAEVQACVESLVHALQSTFGVILRE